MSFNVIRVPSGISLQCDSRSQISNIFRIDEIGVPLAGWIMNERISNYQSCLFFDPSMCYMMTAFRMEPDGTFAADFMLYGTFTQMSQESIRRTLSVFNDEIDDVVHCPDCGDFDAFCECQLSTSESSSTESSVSSSTSSSLDSTSPSSETHRGWATFEVRACIGCGRPWTECVCDSSTSVAGGGGTSSRMATTNAPIAPPISRPSEVVDVPPERRMFDVE